MSSRECVSSPKIYIIREFYIFHESLLLFHPSFTRGRSAIDRPANGNHPSWLWTSRLVADMWVTLFCCCWMRNENENHVKKKFNLCYLEKDRPCYSCVNTNTNFIAAFRHWLNLFDQANSTFVKLFFFSFSLSCFVVVGVPSWIDGMDLIFIFKCVHIAKRSGSFNNESENSHGKAIAESETLCVINFAIRRNC